MFVYVLTNTHGTLYIGATSNLPKRLVRHADTSHDSFAHRYNCDRLIYTEQFNSITDAIRREKQLKGWRRAKKVALIVKVNPHWQTVPLG